MFSGYSEFKQNGKGPYSHRHLNCFIYCRYKGAREIIHGTKYHMLKEGDVYSLIVNDVYGEDADEYVCRAVNKGGIKSTRAELIIMSKCTLLKDFSNPVKCR
jgi:hypothetical protein